VSKPGGGLGRGLASLIPNAGQVEPGDQRELPIEQVVPNPDQPRTLIDEEQIAELSDSVKKVGVLQPILVRKAGETYQIVAGERRWRASKAAGLTKVPVRIIEASDGEVLELALIENLQREDLNAIEEARCYRRLLDERQMTQAELADKVSKSRSAITNALRLMDLPDEVQEMVYENRLTAGHARAVLSVPDEQLRIRLATKVIDEGLSVREAENIARLMAAGQEAERPSRPITPKSFKLAARRLRRLLGTNVRVKIAKDKGKIEIDFQNEEELQRIFDLISGAPVETEGADA
jgi:ParB family chromosome partitioning protein